MLAKLSIVWYLLCKKKKKRRVNKKTHMYLFIFANRYLGRISQKLVRNREVGKE